MSTAAANIRDVIEARFSRKRIDVHPTKAWGFTPRLLESSSQPNLTL